VDGGGDMQEKKFRGAAKGLLKQVLANSSMTDDESLQSALSREGYRAC
jgi:hypothetical protein